MYNHYSIFPYFNLDSSMTESFYDVYNNYIDSEQFKEISPNEIKPETQKNIISQTQTDNSKTKSTNNQVLSINIPEIQNTINTEDSQKLIGKKRENTKKKEHDKYAGDNIIRKLKSAVLSNLTNFINEEIYKAYEGNINKGILKKELKKLDQSQIKNVKDNKEFIYKCLKDIFNAKISGRYTNFLNEHNQNLIKDLLNEKDEEKRKKFEKIFNLNFLQCLGHFSGKIYIEELEGLKKLKETFKEFEDDNDYMQLLEKYALDLEDIILRKKSRNRGKKSKISKIEKKF